MSGGNVFSRHRRTDVQASAPPQAKAESAGVIGVEEAEQHLYLLLSTFVSVSFFTYIPT